MNIQADTIEEYFSKSGNHEPEMREMDKFIRQSAPHLTPVVFGGMSGTWLGYGMHPYQTKSMKEPGEWPVVALAAQKNHIGLYIMSTEDDQYIAEKYADSFGKVSVGKSCVRFKKVDDLELSNVAKVLKRIDTQYASGKDAFRL